ncbi:MAG: type II toxin-antitoxin system VapB family antitoxin [Methyloprofundus sp.]|nr:type II toxin-antitoxin system VapB family antitoxin [Methyloprofundus sp.]
MLSNLTIDDQLINEAQAISQHSTQQAVVIEALQEYIQKRRQLKIINLFNTIDYDKDYDYKQQRAIK